MGKNETKVLFGNFNINTRFANTVTEANAVGSAIAFLEHSYRQAKLIDDQNF